MNGPRPWPDPPRGGTRLRPSLGGPLVGSSRCLVSARRRPPTVSGMGRHVRRTVSAAAATARAVPALRCAPPPQPAPIPVPVPQAKPASMGPVATMPTCVARSVVLPVPPVRMAPVSRAVTPARSASAMARARRPVLVRTGSATAIVADAADACAIDYSVVVLKRTLLAPATMIAPAGSFATGSVSVHARTTLDNCGMGASARARTYAPDPSRITGLGASVDATCTRSTKPANTNLRHTCISCIPDGHIGCLADRHGCSLGTATELPVAASKVEACLNIRLLVRRRSDESWSLHRGERRQLDGRT